MRHAYHLSIDKGVLQISKIYGPGMPSTPFITHIIMNFNRPRIFQRKQYHKYKLVVARLILIFFDIATYGTKVLVQIHQLQLKTPPSISVGPLGSEASFYFQHNLLFRHLYNINENLSLTKIG